MKLHVHLVGLGAALASHPASAQAGPLNAANVGQIALALVFVLAVIVAMAWLVRRSGHPMVGGNSVPMRVLGGVSVGQRERVVLVQVGERQLLLGVTPGRIATLDALETPLAVDSTAPAGAGARPLLDLMAGRGR